MKRLFFIFLIMNILSGCTPEIIDSQNPYIPNTSVSFTVYLNLPSYHSLNYLNNGILQTGQGYNGVIIFNNGSGFVAYEATCSNHEINENSNLNIDGTVARCNSCDRYYYLLNGQPGEYKEASPYFLNTYRVEVNQNQLYISN